MSQQPNPLRRRREGMVDMEKWTPAYDFSLPSIAAMRERGPYLCSQCGAFKLELPGICDRCGAQNAAEQKRDRVQKALDSIPEGFRVMRFGSPELLSACQSQRRIDNAKKCIDKMLSRQEHMALIDGPTGTGKTSVACAMLVHAIQTSPKMGPGCRFVFSPFIARAYSETRLGMTPEVIDTCHSASLLVIDDLGQDDVYRDNVRTVIQSRDAERRPTIVTTFLSEAAVEATYGGGISRRLFSQCARLVMSAPTKKGAAQ